jgi:hypothetical protein
MFQMDGSTELNNMNAENMRVFNKGKGKVKLFLC